VARDTLFSSFHPQCVSSLILVNCLLQDLLKQSLTSPLQMEPAQLYAPVDGARVPAPVGYRYLVRDIGFFPENIIISGDFSGGNLACALARYLAASALPNIPQVATASMSAAGNGLADPKGGATLRRYSRAKTRGLPGKCA
jgi:hypothetical protein